MPSLEVAQAYLKALDLNYLIDFMCGERYPLPRWIRAEAEYCCQLYKNFLWLNKQYPDQTLVPTLEIDEFWHNHILYTKNYARDCLMIFGHYFHHEPMESDEDPEILTANYLETKRLYLTEFGMPLSLVK